MTMKDALCVVSGASSGIGLATARSLIRAGADVIGIAREGARLSAAAAELGARFVPLGCDLTAAPERERVAARLAADVRPLALFVNNAAACLYETPLRVPAESLSRLFELNVTAGLELCQALAPRLAPGSHVIQVSSVSGRQVPNAKFGPYGATKAALDHLTLALRLELQPRGVRVGSIVLGLVDTPIYDTVPSFDRAREKLRELVPAWLRPEDVAEAILWMVSRPPHAAVHELVLMPSAQTS